MSKNTMSIALPESMRSYVAGRVNGGSYGNTSEYIRDLVRKDQTDQAIVRLQTLVEEGIASGDAQQLVIMAGLAPKQIEQDPGIGCPRLELLAEIQCLRSWRVKGFPLVWFNLEREDHLDLIRLLGERQDILSIQGDEP